MKVRVEVQTTSYITQDADPDDSWDRPNTAQDIVGWRAVKVEDNAKTNEDYYGERESLTVEVDDDSDEVFVVYAVYSTGDTFGNDSGQVQIADAFDDEATAWELYDEFKKFDSTGYGRNDVVPFDFHFKDKQYYIPWAGYFEHLERLGVEPVRVRLR